MMPKFEKSDWSISSAEYYLHVSLIPNFLWLVQICLYFYFYFFSFFTSVIFIRHPTICGEMNGFLGFILEFGKWCQKSKRVTEALVLLNIILHVSLIPISLWLVQIILVSFLYFVFHFLLQWSLLGIQLSVVRWMDLGLYGVWGMMLKFEKSDWSISSAEYYFACQSDPKFCVVGTNHFSVYFMFCFSFFTAVIFILRPTICGVLTGFRVYIGVWEMIPNLKKSDWSIGSAE